MKKNLQILLLVCFTHHLCYSQNVNKDLVNRNNDFAFSLLSEINSVDDSDNIFFSSFSISSAMAMTYDGARWITAMEMRRVMNFNRNRNLSHQEFTNLLKYYNNLKHGFLHIANAAVAQKNYTFLESYFEQLSNYGALLKTADFRDDDNREKARKQINKWVADNTNNRIEELLDKNALDALTRLVLLNAIHFNADWSKPFPVRQTHTDVFISPTGEVSSEFMNIRDNLNYYQNDEIQMVQLAYQDTIASMFILLPKPETDLNSIINAIDADAFNSYISGIRNTPIQLSMPKFKLETEYELKDIFENMGMKRAFSLKANFSGMTGKKDLMIDQVIHKAFIEVDEEGTEAAAATAVIMREKSAPRYIQMNINRPFVFIIKEHNKNSILFIGKISSPTKN